MTPDIILTPYSGITQDEYNTLSQIAPTVAYPKVSWGTSWQDDQTITGEALGMKAASEKLIADTEALLASQTDKYPQLAGKTFIYGNLGDGSVCNIYTVTDPRSQFMTEIGLEASDFVKNLKVDDPSVAYYVPVSYELAATLGADVVVFWFASQEDYNAAAKLPAFKAIPAVKRGSFALVIGKPLVMASSAFSVLSIPFMLDEFLPVLAAAAYKA